MGSVILSESCCDAKKSPIAARLLVAPSQCLVAPHKKFGSRRKIILIPNYSHHQSNISPKKSKIIPYPNENNGYQGEIEIAYK